MAHAVRGGTGAGRDAAGDRAHLQAVRGVQGERSLRAMEALEFIQALALRASIFFCIHMFLHAEQCVRTFPSSF